MVTPRTAGFTARKKRMVGSGYYRPPGKPVRDVRRSVAKLKIINSSKIKSFRNRLSPRGRVVLDALIVEFRRTPRAVIADVAVTLSKKLSAPRQNTITYANPKNYYGPWMIADIFGKARNAGVIRLKRT